MSTLDEMNVAVVSEILCFAVQPLQWLSHVQQKERITCWQGRCTLLFIYPSAVLWPPISVFLAILFTQPPNFCLLKYIFYVSSLTVRLDIAPTAITVLHAPDFFISVYEYKDQSTLEAWIFSRPVVVEEILKSGCVVCCWGRHRIWDLSFSLLLSGRNRKYCGKFLRR